MPESVQKRIQQSSNLADMANFFNNYSDSSVPARLLHKQTMPEQLQALNSKFEFCLQAKKEIKFESRVHAIFTQQLSHLAKTLTACEETQPLKVEPGPLDNKAQTGLSIT